MFDKINLTIYSPDKSKEVLVEVNTILTVRQVIEELLQNQFLPGDSSQRCRQLLVEGSGCILSPDCTLQDLPDHEAVRMVIFPEPKPAQGNRIAVTFLHPTNTNSIEVEVPDTLTADEAVRELIACGFMAEPDNPGKGYYLFIKNSQTDISGRQTLASGGTVNGSVLKVVPYA